MFLVRERSSALRIHRRGRWVHTLTGRLNIAHDGSVGDSCESADLSCDYSDGLTIGLVLGLPLNHVVSHVLPFRSIDVDNRQVECSYVNGV